MAYPTPTTRPGRSRSGAPRRLILWVLLACSAPASPALAGSNNQADITSLTDVAFGTLGNLGADAVRSQSICVFAKSQPVNQYSITANGSGAGGAFTLSSGSANLAYDVQWSASPNQISGTQLTPNQPLTGQSNSASSSDCSTGPATTASLIVILRSAELSSAASGTYTGTLTLLVTPQ